MSSPIEPAGPALLLPAAEAPPARDHVRCADRPPRLVAIVGNPNSGKSTLFNRLTGLNQKVANYPGVTVEKKMGRAHLTCGCRVDLLDLPGTYSLRPRSPDERIVRDVLLGLNADTPAPELVVFVLDATSLDRHLYLALQVIEIGRPVVIALNMIDAARVEGIEIDVPALTRVLGAPVVPVSGRTGEGIARLREWLEHGVPPAPEPMRRLTPEMDRALGVLAASLSGRRAPGAVNPRHLAMALLLDEDDEEPLWRTSRLAQAAELRGLREGLDAADPGWRTQEPVGHFEAIEKLLARVTRRPRRAKDPVRDRIDRVLTHRVFGPLIFFLLMATVFQSIFTWATPAMDAIESGFTALGHLVGALLPAGPLRSLFVDGVIAGAGTVIQFVPQIAILFLFIALMEDTGYMARAAFIMDRLMAGVGLSGRAFIPLLSSFACAIPGILATRTIEDRRDRLTTIFIAPFMSCSARLPVYALLIGAFIPARRFGPINLQGLTLFALYLLGIVTAVAAAWLLKRSALRGKRPLYVMELPPYRVPSPKAVFLTVRNRSWVFVQKAGTVIVAVSIVLWFLASFPTGHPETKALQARLAAAPTTQEAAHLRTEVAGSELRHSFAGQVGHWMEPAIAPLGFNWKIGVALLTSFAAREVMVSTMATVYNLEDASDSSLSLRQKLRGAVDPRTGRPEYTLLTALSLLVFYVLALQCMSTLAVVRRETNSWRWPIAMLLVMNSLAWVASFAVFQGGRMLGLG
jgi:ferrous iron transport protein B